MVIQGYARPQHRHRGTPIAFKRRVHVGQAEIEKGQARDVVEDQRIALTCRYPNDEHENDSANAQRVDFKRVVYTSQLGNEKDMEDDDLPRKLLKLVELGERQISPQQEVTKAINLGTKEERKEVKIGATLLPTTRKKLMDLL